MLLLLSFFKLSCLEVDCTNSSKVEQERWDLHPLKMVLPKWPSLVGKEQSLSGFCGHSACLSKFSSF